VRYVLVCSGIKREQFIGFVSIVTDFTFKYMIVQGWCHSSIFFCRNQLPYSNSFHYSASLNLFPASEQIELMGQVLLGLPRCNLP